MDRKASALIKKFLDAKCTPEERATLLAHFNQYLDQNRHTLSPEEIQQLHKITWEGINAQIDYQEEEKNIVPLWRQWIPYVAAVFVLLIGAWVFIQQQAKDSLVTTADIASDITPLGDRATLTLADGRNIDLDATQSGIVFSDDRIIYQNGARVGDEKLSTAHYQLATPKGATYQVTLPDGTKVWLNGDSEITYPGRFDGSKRIVSLKGEAYFDVVRQDGMPFIVKTEGQEIQVLGTTFNISTYHAVKTTLVEGSVKVVSTSQAPSALLLEPGEQAVSQIDGTINRQKANLNKELAWKSGMFYFEQTPVSEIMQQVGRWYDVEIRYEAGIPNGTFSGIMARNVSLRTLLEFLEESSPKFGFKLQDRTLIVSPKGDKN